MRNLYLHIGNHRTATTSIQRFMASNFLHLKGKGYLYPYGLQRHNQLITDLAKNKQDIVEVSRVLNNRANKKDSAIHSIVLSDEDISTHDDLTFLTGFKKHFNVKIVFSLRRQDLWLESWYFQNIKWQWNPDLAHISVPEFFEKRNNFHWINYQNYIQHLETLFGRENILLNVFERGQMQDGPVLSFCDLIGLKPGPEFMAPPSDNASLSPTVSEFLRQLPLDKARPKLRTILETAVHDVNAQYKDVNESRFILSHEQRKTVFAEHKKGNKWVASEYFSRSKLFFDLLPNKKTEINPMTLPGDSAKLMENLIQPYMRALIKLCHERLL